MKIALIACCKSKLDHSCRAEDLYVGALFKKQLAFSRDQNFDRIFILSALHGLLKLDEVIQSYEKTLTKMPVAERKKWAAAVEFVLPDNAEITYFAGVRYREFLPCGDVPCEGLGIGRQLKWFKDRGY